MRRNDAAINQQKELHQLAVQRERLQIKALEEQMTKQAEANAAKLEREREVRGLNLDRPLSSILPNDNANSVYYSFIYSYTSCGFDTNRSCICSVCRTNKKYIKYDWRNTTKCI